MRISLLGTMVVGVVGVVGLGTASATPIRDFHSDISKRSIVEQVQSDRYCARLRRACEYKDERGEQGEGNCRRYRRECGRN
jgi:hypothetical protein